MSEFHYEAWDSAAQREAEALRAVEAARAEQEGGIAELVQQAPAQPNQPPELIEPSSYDGKLISTELHHLALDARAQIDNLIGPITPLETQEATDAPEGTQDDYEPYTGPN